MSRAGDRPSDAGSGDRVGGERERPLEKRELLVVRPETSGPFGSLVEQAERPARKRGRLLTGTKPHGFGQMVDHNGQQLDVADLFVAVGDPQVESPTLRAGDRPQRHLANHALHELVETMFHRSRIVIDPE